MRFILATLTLLLLALPGCVATQNLGGGGSGDGSDPSDADPRDADPREDDEYVAESGDPVIISPDPVFDGDAEVPPDAVMRPPIPDGGLWVFVTSTSHRGDLGGLAGADAICEARAAEAGLDSRWVAWLSDSRVDAIDRIEGDGPWYRLDGRMAFEDAAQLGSTALVPLHVDESGAVPGDPRYRGCFRAWTGTRTGGRASGAAAIELCSDWTSSDAQHPDAPDFRHQAETGSCDRIDEWTETFSRSCDTSNQLYCFEAP